MKTCDYEQVNAIMTPIKAKLQDCAHGEGNQCQTLDKHLDCCADICLEAHKALATWSQDVFAGRVVYDHDAEQLWRAEMGQIYSQAKRAWLIGRRAEVPCFELPGQAKLEVALWYLSVLLENWVTPKLSVAPSPRVSLQLDDAATAAIRQQLANLPAPAGAASSER